MKISAIKTWPTEREDFMPFSVSGLKNEDKKPPQYLNKVGPFDFV